MSKSKMIPALIAAIVAVGALCGIASAGTSPNLILCADKKSGALRYAASCKPSETLIALSTKGEVGANGNQGPKGDTGAPGPTGPRGETGPQGASALQQANLKVMDQSFPKYDSDHNVINGSACADGTMYDHLDPEGDWTACTLNIPKGSMAYIFMTLGGINNSVFVDAFSKQCSELTFQELSTVQDSRNPAFPITSESLYVVSGHDYSNQRTNGIPLSITKNGGCVSLHTPDVPIVINVVPN